ncbi:MAG: hypothetical protein HY556_11305 [Euryarchaeota archaeon]|nr:hypothetical protein [Euryarchaeota archaeon]
MSPNVSGTGTYALERVRLRVLRRRRFMIYAVLFLFFGFVVYNLATSSRTDNSISTLGGGSSSVSLPAPDGGAAPQKRGPDATVALTPGRIQRLDKSIGPGSEDDGSTAGRGSPGQSGPRQAITEDAELVHVDWSSVGRFLMIMYIVYRLGRWALKSVRDAYGEVNFGVYKGASPVELHLTHKNLRRTIVKDSTLVAIRRTPATPTGFSVVGRR